MKYYSLILEIFLEIVNQIDLFKLTNLMKVSLIYNIETIVFPVTHN